MPTGRHLCTMLNGGFNTSWTEVLTPMFNTDFYKRIQMALTQAKEQGLLVYPNEKDVFKAFELTPFHAVKVVILGQDPYHNPNQAHGLSFSVPDGIPIPPSLRNIFIELESDLGIKAPQSGNLSNWAKQGVLLLNASLTVEAHRANSHKEIGWQLFTNEVITAISNRHEYVIFVLWGSFAQSKLNLIDHRKHTVLCAPHPSPLSAYKGFFGSKPFSTINTHLVAHKKKPIQWG